MKYLIFLLSPFFAIAQNDFKVEKEQVIWQKVFDNNVSSNDFDKSFKTRTLFLNSQFSDNQIYGITEPKTLIKYDWSMPIYASYLTYFTYRVEFKENRYRVTVNDITQVVTTDKTETTLTGFILKKDQTLRTGRNHQKFLLKLHEALDKEFTYKPESKW
jgi:hypothetical protein